jgi:hypothetical protein
MGRSRRQKYEKVSAEKHFFALNGVALGSNNSIYPVLKKD